MSDFGDALGDIGGYIGDVWGDFTSFLGGLFGGSPDLGLLGDVDAVNASLLLDPSGAGVVPQINLVAPDVGLPGLDLSGLGAPITEKPDEEEDDPLKDEKKAAALAARALQAQERGRSGRSSTFLTRGMNLGTAPARRRALLGQGW